MDVSFTTSGGVFAYQNVSFTTGDGYVIAYQNGAFSQDPSLIGVYGSLVTDAATSSNNTWKGEDQVMVLLLPNGIYLQWDGVKALSITVPFEFRGSLCGICGRIDDPQMYIGPFDVTHKDDSYGCTTKAASKLIQDTVEQPVLDAFISSNSVSLLVDG
jgi:hypothetical protein